MVALSLEGGGLIIKPNAMCDQGPWASSLHWFV